MLILTTIDENVSYNNNTNKPELRHSKIINICKSKYDILFLKLIITSNEIKKLNIHDPLMIDFIENSYLSFAKSQNDKNFSSNNNILIPYNFPKEKNIDLIKDLEYYKQTGFWCDDHYTPIHPNTWKTVLQTANICYNVYRFININDNNIIYCLNIHPGHHATSYSFGGYCFLNNCAIITKSLLKFTEIKKIAILDIDYHAGNGTSEIFKNDENILTISIHINPKYDYPFYYGYETENTETNINLLFEPKTDINIYIKLLVKAINYIHKFAPDCLIIAFGGDTYKNDTDTNILSRCELEIEDYKKISKKIKDNFDKKIIISQEGGYNIENIDKIAESFLSGFE
jgi:acetoin utilization deacetylase AcuC-like enzyme